MLSVHMETSCWYCHDGGSKTSIKITSWWFWSQGKYKPSFYDHKWVCCQGLDRDNYYICGVCGNVAHSVDLPITAVSPRPCVPVLERSGAPQPAVPRPSALRRPITISPRPMKNCGSSAAARAGLGEFDTTSTTHCQIIAGGGLGKLTQFTDLQI